MLVMPAVSLKWPQFQWKVLSMEKIKDCQNSNKNSKDIRTKMTNLVNTAKSQWNSTNQIDSDNSFIDNVIMIITICTAEFVAIVIHQSMKFNDDPPIPWPFHH